MRLATLKSLAARPRDLGYETLSRITPPRLWRRYQGLCRRNGLTKPRFVLSLDCDTDLDIRVVEGVHLRLQESGITPIYAVPGELLERGSHQYRSIAETGAQFLNHGYRPHTSVDAQRTTYTSTHFYNDLSLELVADDIRAGHRAIQDVLGFTATGFRTPHFGSFQHPRQLRFVHDRLRDMGYRVSSSTLPIHAFRNGPWYQQSGLWEFPLTGCLDRPLSPLDTWSFRFAPDRRGTEQDYISQINRLAGWMEQGVPLFINIYGDPSQVYDWPEFFTGVARFAPFCAVSYLDLLPTDAR